jgi:hypothetical protein
MLVRLTRDAAGIVVQPGNTALSPFRATTVCLTDVTFEKDGSIVGDSVEAIKSRRDPGREIRRNWKRAAVKDGACVDIRSNEMVTKARGAYIVDDNIWYLP